MDRNIRLRLFGFFQVEVDGKIIQFSRRKSQNLIAYLALHNLPQSREKIASMLWSDSSDEDARRSLRVTLTDIRKKLGDEILIASRDELSLNSSQIIEIDVQNFSQLLSSHKPTSTIDLIPAIEIYRGDLLEVMDDEWITPFRDEYRTKMVEALSTLIEHLRAQGDYAHAIEHAERLLSLDPYNEKAVQYLLICLTANGNKELALKRFKEIQAQGNIEFSPETLALHKNVQREISTSARLTNLARPNTSFIGRENELNEIQTMLTHSRLVTLLGAGGSGKTRLAIQTADEILYQYQGGAWWVDFSSLLEPNLVPQAISNSLGVKEQSNRNILELIAERIGDETLLLILDNCEHLLSACAQSAEYLLAHCPQLTILATSREALGIEAEVGWQVPTFPLPEAELDLKTLQKNEAARLFVERGRSANQSFQLTADNALDVIYICRRLDGIPLAIELTAALLRTMAITDISHKLEQRFAMLHISEENKIPRQQTMHALIDWGYNLLTNTEQIFFRRLGVFAGGWTFDSAVVVAGGFEAKSIQENFSSSSAFALPINPADVTLALLESLQKRSLIRSYYHGNDPRYLMSEPLREYALERLQHKDEIGEVRARHLQYMVTFTQEADLHLHGKPDAVQWAEKMPLEMDNVRAALQWGMERGNIQEALALGSAMQLFWLTRGFGNEGRDWLKRLLEHPRTPQGTFEHALILMNYASSLRTTNNVAQAIPIIEKAVKEFTTLGNEREQAIARFTQGDIHLYVGNLDEAEIHLSTALVYFRASPQESYYLVNTLSSLGRVAHARNDLENAYHYIEESSKLSKEAGNLSTFAWNQTVLGDIAYTQDNLALARENYEASLENYRTLNRSINMSYLYEVLGSLAYWRGELDLATKLLEECFKQYILANSDDGTAFSFGYYASILQSQKNMEGAKHWLQYAASPISKIDNIYRSVYAVKLADYAQAIGDSTSATVLYLYALRLTSDPTTALFPPDRQHAQAKLESIRRSLNEAEFEALSKQAKSLQIEEAVRLVFPT